MTLVPPSRPCVWHAVFLLLPRRRRMAPTRMLRPPTTAGVCVDRVALFWASMVGSVGPGVKPFTAAKLSAADATLARSVPGQGGTSVHGCAVALNCRVACAKA